MARVDPRRATACGRRAGRPGLRFMPNRTIASLPFPRLVALVLATALLFATSLRSGAQTSGTGTVTGRVSDAQTKLALGGARIALPGSALATFADAAGNYTLRGVPAGVQTLEFTYVGYPEFRQTVTVPSDGRATADIAFGSDTVQLEKFVIQGSLVGSARAINQQRSAAALTSIVAADEIGRFPDQNAAESLQRLPGVSLYRDQGEGRFVDLRGLNYTYTAVSLNGAKVASPERAERSIALDVVPADALASLEVAKVITPDMDAEGLGGAINIRTKSPFDATGTTAHASAQAIYNRLTDQFGSKFDASASTLFAGGKAGLLVSATWQERKFGSQNIEMDSGWTLRNAPGGGAPAYFLNEIAFRDYEILRTRYGAGASLAFKPEAGTTLQFNATFNRFTDEENRHIVYLPFTRGTLTALDARSATVTAMSRPRRDLRVREKDQELRAFSADFSRKTGDWTFSARAAHSVGEETRPEELTVRFRRNAADTSLRYTFDGLYAPRVEQLAGTDLPNPASYETLDRLQLLTSGGEERDTNVAVQVRRDFAGTTPAYLKTGAAYRTKDKENVNDVARYTAPATFTFANLAGRISAYPFGPRVPQIDPAKAQREFLGNRTAFRGTPLFPDTEVEDWNSEEKVLAGYAMGGFTAGATHVLGGVRVERTEFATRGNQIRGTAVSPTSAGRDYDHVLPGVAVRHEFGRRLVGRVSYTTSLMRPTFSESAIYRTVSDADTDVTAGNPRLATLEARSLDASLEYYLPSLGLVSAAVFHKRIDNFSYSITLPGGDPAFPTYDLITFRNGSDGQVSGLELAWQQQLRFLPAPFDGLGFMANTTLVDSKAEYPTRPGEKLPFIGQSDVTGNVALTYEKGRFFARLALNWRDAHLREDEPIGADATTDFWIDDFAQLDLSTSFRVTRNFELFAEVSNLTDEPFRVFQRGGGQPPRFVQFEEYGWTANFGLRWKL
jgi:TonB-dependent receptor